MKRTFFLLAIIIPLFAHAQQRYISSAIIAFSGGAYERTIKDINMALLDEQSLKRDDLAKAYFYRGLATKKLIERGEASIILDSNPELDAYNDFRYVQSLDLDEWAARAATELSGLVEGLKRKATSLLSQAERSEGIISIRLIENALTHVNALNTLSSGVDVSLLQGRVYNQFGEYFDVSDPVRAVDNFNTAIRFLELALQQSSACQICVERLLEVARNLDDEVRIQQYELMLSGFGN